MRATIFAIDVSCSYRIGREIARRSLARDASPYCLSAAKRRGTTGPRARSDWVPRRDAAFPADTRVERTFSVKNNGFRTRRRRRRVRNIYRRAYRLATGTYRNIRVVQRKLAFAQCCHQRRYLKPPHGSGAGNAPNFTNELSKFRYLRNDKNIRRNVCQITEIIPRHDAM